MANHYTFYRENAQNIRHRYTPVMYKVIHTCPTNLLVLIYDNAECSANAKMCTDFLSN